MRVVAVRPYIERIRGRVFKLLARCGAEVGVIIPRGSSDSEALELLRRERDVALLIPFHAHLDKEGKEVNGLDFATKLHTALPALAAAPILMPVSAAAKAGVGLLLADERRVPPAVRERILFMQEDELDSEALEARVRAHLGGTPSRSPLAANLQRS